MRFYLPPAACQSAVLFLTGREAHHARHVLRVQRGQSLSILDGLGQEFLCEVADFDHDKVSLRVRQKNSQPPSPCQITLLQALPKGKIIESIIQKSAELGVARIVPLLAERVVVRLNEKEAEARAVKWQSIAIEAIKQCGALWLPKVEIPMTPADFLARRETFELPLIASLQSACHPRAHFQAFYAQQGRLPHSVCVWVGPEGDFAPAELEAILAAGARPITLGPLVLRVETAATYCLSILNYELQSPPCRPWK